METERKYYPYGCITLYRERSTRNGSVFKAWKFEFECFWKSNRSGFVHEWDLYYNGSFYPDQSYKIQYYNRTWERFEYESLIKNLFIDFLYKQDRKFIEENQEDILAIAEDLQLNFWKVFRIMKTKEQLLEKYNN